jgi:hypothetical protein
VPEFLTAAFTQGPAVRPLPVLMRLVVAMILGGIVAWVYRRTRSATQMTPSLPPTLVLLSILIAIVTQVIGDSVARAFSLVGALSIVRFRTIVRDTQDTAFVIFAVVVGMAVGASDLWVAVIGLGIVSLAAYLMMSRPKAGSRAAPPFVLNLRLGMTQDLNALLGGTLDSFLLERRLLSMSTARQGLALEVSYEIRLRPDGSPDALVKALNRIDDVQSVELQLRDAGEESPL